MARTPLRLHGPAQVSNSAATKYTADTKTVITHIHVYNPGSAATFTLSIGNDAAGTRLFDAVSIAEDVPFDAWGPYTIENGEVIQALSGTNNQLVLTIDGYEVT